VGDRAAVAAFVNAPVGAAGNGVRSAAVAAGIAAAAAGGGAAGAAAGNMELQRRKIAEADRRLKAAAVARETEDAAKASAVAAGRDPMAAVREQRARQFEEDKCARAAVRQRERVAEAAKAADAAKAKLAAAKAAFLSKGAAASPYAQQQGVGGGRAAALAAAGRSPAPGAPVAARRLAPSSVQEAAVGEVAASRALGREPPAAAVAAAAYEPKSPPRNLYRPVSAPPRKRPQTASATMKRDAEEKADTERRADRAQKLRERDMAGLYTSKTHSLQAPGSNP
jgi:hypothetical protein